MIPTTRATRHLSSAYILEQYSHLVKRSDECSAGEIGLDDVDGVTNADVEETRDMATTSNTWT